MPDGHVLVVGTTPDYVALIRERYPQRVIFLTDVSQYAGNTGYRPGDTDEILCELSDKEAVFPTLKDYLEKQNLGLSGVAGYDCEWLALAAEIAKVYALPFPSEESVRLSRDKYLTKQRWTERGVRCPRIKLVRSEGQAIRFIEKLGRPVVLKPLTGSGSELTFRCDNASEIAPLLHTISKGLVQKSESPLYREGVTEVEEGDDRLAILAEEFIEGTEYSADFIVEDNRVTIIRTARKIRDPQLPFGTAAAYVVPATLPEGLGSDLFSRRLGEAARALGLTRAICMVDLMITGSEIVFLELTPRIGGDCLPPLVRQCCGLDTIGLALDFAENRAWSVPASEQWQRLVGLRLLAAHKGVVSRFKTTGLSDDGRVREVYVKRSPGHRIELPPRDYDSWVLGHVIFAPRPNLGIEEQCEALRQKFVVELERKDGTELPRVHNASRGTS